VFRVDHPSVAVWTAWSHHCEHGDMAWFHHHHDNVAVKNPDREIRRKMWRLAERLGAKVQGDDGEYYDRFGNPTDDASKTRTYWPALFRHLGFALIWGDPVGRRYPAGAIRAISGLRFFRPEIVERAVSWRHNPRAQDRHSQRGRYAGADGRAGRGAQICRGARRQTRDC
jgi:hypothetical protein